MRANISHGFERPEWSKILEQENPSGTVVIVRHVSSMG